MNSPSSRSIGSRFRLIPRCTARSNAFSCTRALRRFTFTLAPPAARSRKRVVRPRNALSRRADAFPPSASSELVPTASVSVSRWHEAASTPLGISMQSDPGGRAVVEVVDSALVTVVVVETASGAPVVVVVDVVEVEVLLAVVEVDDVAVVEVLVVVDVVGGSVVGGRVVVVVTGQSTPQQGSIGSCSLHVPTAGVVNGSGHWPTGPAGTNFAVGWMTGGVDR